MTTITQVEPGVTNFKVEAMIKIVKSFMFSGMASKESERQIRQGYKEFFEPIFEDKLL